MTLYRCVEWVFVITTLPTLISLFVFSRVSMRRIDKKFREEGIDRARWDWRGVRAIWYAGAIVLPICRINPPDHPLIDPVAVKRHATAADRKLAWWLMISMYSWLASMLLLHFLDRN